MLLGSPGLSFIQIYTENRRWLGWNLALPKTKQERVKLAKLANFKPVQMPENTELGQRCQLFCDALVGLEDSTAPCRSLNLQISSSIVA